MENVVGAPLLMHLVARISTSKFNCIEESEKQGRNGMITLTTPPTLTVHSDLLRLLKKIALLEVEIWRKDDLLLTIRCKFYG